MWIAFLLLACGEDPLVGDTADASPTVEITAGSFRCVNEMAQVRYFFVDNLLGDLDATVAAATTPDQAQLPPGSVVQLVPQEAMVKREAGFSPATNDWEFFFLEIGASGTTIAARGTTDVVNAFGGSCFACHAPAAARDFICEVGHGCDALPIGPSVFASLRDADPRCGA